MFTNAERAVQQHPNNLFYRIIWGGLIVVMIQCGT